MEWKALCVAPGVLAHALGPSIQMAEAVLEIRLQDSQGWYTGDPCLKQPKEEERKIGKKENCVAILL